MFKKYRKEDIAFPTQRRCKAATAAVANLANPLKCSTQNHCQDIIERSKIINSDIW